jgi:glycosyltransferase involved in cell wall biosynthesis
MKILLAAASFAANISGVQRHALNMARCLLSQPEVSELHLVVAPWQCGMVQAADLPPDARLTIHVAGMNRGSLSRNLWYYRELSSLASQLSVDVVHLTLPMPLRAAAFHCPTVVTLHDLYPFEIPMNFGVSKFLFNRIVLQQCLHAADAIACVSDTTRMRLKQYAPASVWRKATRIYNCVEPVPDSAVESPISGWRQEPFLLSIAQHRRNKNIPTLLRGFDRLLRSDWIEADAKLVVVGIRGPETETINALVRELGLGKSVHFLEGLKEEELQWCYRNCEVLVAPSLTEGFGLPVAEGLLAGCRIVCSSIPAHREIGEGHCRFVALHENAAEALATVIADALADPKPLPVDLPQLSAPVLADQYLSLYRDLIASTATRSKNAEVGAAHVRAPETAKMGLPKRESALGWRGE